MKALLSSSYDDLVHRFSRWLRIAGGLFARPGNKASNDLLSVLAAPGQTPHSMFALGRI